MNNSSGSTDVKFPDNLPRLSSFDFFLLALSILSIINLVFLIIIRDDDTRSVVLLVDGLVALFFLGNFAIRMVRAKDRSAYFLEERGWLDLLAAIPIPGFRLARIGHVVREMRMIRAYGIRVLLHNSGAERATVSLLIAIVLTVCVLEAGSVLVIRPESDAESANITSAGDALWWSYVTITTVGYGDQFPVTTRGRLVGLFMMSIGVALFAVITGFLANAFVSPRAQRRAAEEREELRAAEIRELRAAVEMLGDEIRQLRGVEAPGSE